MNDRPLEFIPRKRADSNERYEENSNHSDSRHSSGRRSRSLSKQSRDRMDIERLHDSDSNLSQDIPVWNSGIMGVSYPLVDMNMVMESSMLPMNNFGFIPPVLSSETMVGSEPTLLLNSVKEIIHCKSCTLFPPSPNAPLPTTRDRPPGCRTVFVGGLPDNITEEILAEIFEKCGEITTLRLSKKNFCHVRFMYETSVDAAIYLSGYRVRIGSNTDPANTGRLHVDYAQARDDQYEWECRQRQLQREQRHRERMEEERLRPPSPPPVMHYTDHEAAAVAEKIKSEETFAKALQVVVTWLERGDCNKKNVNNFYSMIQSTNSHIRRLLNEKNQYEEELQKAKDIMKGRMQGLLLQFGHIERLFLAACHKKVWDHFTKAQRKNIEAWKKQSLEVKKVQLEEVIEKEKLDDEMDVSDDEEPIKKKSRNDMQANNDTKQENETLRMQMEAYKNEVGVLKMDHKKELEDKEKQFAILQQTLQGMQQQLLEAKRKQNEEEARVKELSAKLKGDTPKSKISIDKDGTINLDDEDVESLPLEMNGATETRPVNDLDAKLIGIISAFLNVHPFGAGLDYIWSYVSKIESNIRPADIESLMTRFPSVFKQELVGIGANMERKWIFSAFSKTADVVNPW